MGIKHPQSSRKEEKKKKKPCLYDLDKVSLEKYDFIEEKYCKINFNRQSFDAFNKKINDI